MTKLNFTTSQQISKKSTYPDFNNIFNTLISTLFCQKFINFLVKYTIELLSRISSYNNIQAGLKMRHFLNHRSPNIKKKTYNEFPNEIILELLIETLSRGKKFRFTAKGWSMFPFIKDGDTLTISPLSEMSISIGKVVAFKQTKPERLIIHRIVRKKGGLFLLKADNSLVSDDGWINAQDLIGTLSIIERNGKRVRCGLGLECYLIAYLSRLGLLSRIINRLDPIVHKKDEV